MPRYTFLHLFKLLDANTLEVLKKIKIGGFEIDAGAQINRGVTFAGIDFFNYVDADFEGKSEKEAIVLEKIYPRG